MPTNHRASSSVIITGAGLSGLASALILAKNGFKVTLCERSQYIGQTLRGFSRQGLYFDTGLHYTGGLGERGVLRPYFQYLGIDSLQYRPFDKNAFDVIRFPQSGREVRIPIKTTAIKKRLTEYFPGEERAINDYIDEALAAYRSSVLLPFQDAIRVSQQNSEWNIPLAEFLGKRTQNKELQSVLAIHCLLHGVAPSRVSFLQHARVAASYFEDVHAIEGGGKALVNALLQELQAYNVTILTKAKVTRCLFKQENVFSGVELEDGRTYDGDIFLYTAHPALLPDMMPAGLFRPAFSHRLRNLDDTISSYLLFVQSDQQIEDIVNRNLFICPSPTLDSAFIPEHSPGDGPFYITAAGGNTSQNKYGAMICTSGHIRVMLQWQNSKIGKRPKEYYTCKEEISHTILRNLSAHYHKLSSFSLVDSATPLTVRDYLHSPQGGLYGAAHSLSQFCPLPVTKIPNIFLAGQSVVAPGIIGVMVSAFLACGFIVGQQKLTSEVQQCRHSA